MKILPLIALAALAVTAPSLAQDAPTAHPSPNEIVALAAADEWIAIPASELLVMDLAPDAAGNPRRVVIQLMPAPFAQGWVGNIRTLARAHWWDGTQVYRVQDNYVAQWGDVLDTKVLPEGLEAVPESAYVIAGDSLLLAAMTAYTGGGSDSYAPLAGFDDGWPVAGDDQSLWPTHCYGMVGVARGLSPNTGSGAELYTVIGHAPRHLDRNIALVGRVIEGIEHLSSLPRGNPDDLGFYKYEAEWVPIASVRLGDELAEDPAPAFEYLSTESASFARYAEARANRRDPFFIRPAGGADICNIPVPIRRVPGE